MSSVDPFGNVTLSGTDAGQGSINFRSNILLGLSAGTSMSGATLNTIIGNQAAQFLITQDPTADCSHNTAVGEFSVYGALNTRNHTVLGTAAGQELLYGDANIMLGYAAGYRGMVVSNNTFIGNEAGMYQNNAANNVWIGYGAGYRTTSSPPSYMYRTVGIGDGVYRQTVSGYNTIAIGVESVMNVSAARESIVLGTDTAVNTRSLYNTILVGNHQSPTTASGSIILATQPLGLTNVSEKFYVNTLLTGDFATKQVFVNQIPSSASGALVVNGNANVSGEVYANGIALKSTVLSLSAQVTDLSLLVHPAPFRLYTVSGTTSSNQIDIQSSSSSATTALSIAGHHCKLIGDYSQQDLPMTNVFAYISGSSWWVHGEITGSIPASPQTWNFNVLQMNQTLCTISGAFIKYN
jgi:hypothetical protein